MGENIRHALAEFFQRTDVRDPDMHEVSVTVTEVRVSPDGKACTAFVIPLGNSERHAIIVAALNRHAKFIRGELSRKVHLKHTPSIAFELDSSFDEGDKIEQLLSSPHVSQDLEMPDEPSETQGG